MKTNLSQDFEGTGKLYLEIRREALPGDEIECAACGKPNLKHYWKMGMVDCDKFPYKKVHKICDNCHEVLIK